MKYNNIEFDTYFKEMPDKNGYFGKYGGAFIPDNLKQAICGISDCTGIDKSTVEEYKQYLGSSGLSSSSVSRALSALRSLMQYLIFLGFWVK